MANEPNGNNNSDSENEEPPVKKAKPSRVMAYIQFVNRTTRQVDVIWLNYEGQSVKYKTLDPGTYVKVNTYIGHPWIFRDSDTGERMVVKLKEIYEPESTVGPDGAPCRKLINITFPVYALKDRCLQVISRLLPREGDRRACINQLEIPDTLKSDLLKKILR